LHRQQDGKRLRRLAVEPRLLDFADHDGVGLAKNVEPLLAHFAHAAYGQARTGKRMPPDDFLGQSELHAEFSDLVLERSRSGSINVKAKSSGSPPTLWCSLMVAAGPSRAPPLSITSG